APVEETEIRGSAHVEARKRSMVAPRRRYGREDHPMERATGRRCGGGQELDRSGAGQKEVSEVGNRIGDREPGQELLALSGGASQTTQENQKVKERNEEAVEEAREHQSSGAE